jgi:hypothetical protein
MIAAMKRQLDILFLFMGILGVGLLHFAVTEWH